MPKTKQTLPTPEIKDETLEILESENKQDDNEVNIKTVEEKNDSIQAVKPKRKATEIQKEKGRQNLEKGRLIKAENDKKKREEAERIALEEKRLKEERLIKKAIAVKKKQLKQQAILDEISDDDTPIQKIKKIVEKQIQEPVSEAKASEPETKRSVPLEPKAERPVHLGPIIRFV